MSEITKSLSEVLRRLKVHIEARVPVKVELYEFPGEDIACSISIYQFSDVNRTGDCFSIKLNLSAECRVSTSLKSADLKATELAAWVFSAVKGQTFGCTGKPPEKLISTPLGESESHAEWSVNWDQEFYVQKFDITPA